MIRFMVHSFVTRVAYAVRGYSMVAFTTTGAFGNGNQHTNIIHSCLNCSGFSLRFLVCIILCRSFQPVVMAKIHLTVAQI